jgi:murein DD-endopeptidase MepM/ murein hydrolase activator NlpD
MQIIVVSRRYSRPKTFVLSAPAVLAAGIAVVGLIFLIFKLLGVSLAAGDKPVNSDVMADWQATLQAQKDELSAAKAYSEAQVEALAVRTAELQSRLLRLDALAERLASMAKLDKSEFDFSQDPAMGGPVDSETQRSADEPLDFIETLDMLTDQIERREQQLEFMESLLSNRKLRDSGMIAGRPIVKGWLSSPYGYRTDPFHGRKAWHKGVDFAGKQGSDIVAVGAGVVTWADKRSGYGNLVQINHGNGYTTRYGHNSEILVKSGDIVKKGQVIAKMGSSGRSTGAHVHFEVLKAGKSVNPLAYINRSKR